MANEYGARPDHVGRWACGCHLTSKPRIKSNNVDHAAWHSARTMLKTLRMVDGVYRVRDAEVVEYGR